MRKDELTLLQNIQKIQQKQTYLLEKPKTPQQQLLHIFAQRHLLSKKMIHKNIEEALNHLPGSFGYLSLRIAYMNLCLENHIELTPEQYPILKLLIDWADLYPTFKTQQLLNLTQAVFQVRQINNFTSLEQYITYVNIISTDIIKMIQRPKNGSPKDSLSSNQNKFSIKHLNKDNLLQYVNYSLPKILINVLLPNDMIPHEFRKVTTIECLYKNASFEYFLRQNQQYGLLMKTLIKILLSYQWGETQQRFLLDIVFRYFYIYHYDKKYNATDIFLEAYNILDQKVRLSLADQINLFFRVARKIGKGKFIDFLIDKSEWLQEINKKVNEKSLIGHAKDKVIPFNTLGLAQTIVVQNGKTEARYFQILEDYSLFYFRISVQSLDVTIRLFYLGEIASLKTQKTLLIEEEKKSGQFIFNIMASKKGIYSFQLDNSYSWMNNKTVRYQNLILTPLQLQSVDRYKWINSYYGDIIPNQITNKQKVWLIRNAAEKKQKEQVYEATANITKKDSFYNMKITFPHQLYQFQSENEEIFIQKFNQWVDTNTKIKWLIAGQPIQDTDNIKSLISDKKSAPKKESPPAPKKERIEAKFQDDQQQTTIQKPKVQKQAPKKKPAPVIKDTSIKKNQQATKSQKPVEKSPTIQKQILPKNNPIVQQPKPKKVSQQKAPLIQQPHPKQQEEQTIPNQPQQSQEAKEQPETNLGVPESTSEVEAIPAENQQHKDEETLLEESASTINKTEEL